jgi:hypothetical protein
MSADDSQNTSPARRRSYGGRRALVGLLLIAAVSTFWWRSYRHCDMLALFGPGGRAGGLVVLRGQLWAIITNIETADAWTAQTATASADDGEALRDLLTVSGTPVVARRWQFFLARHQTDAFGFPGKWCGTVGGPVWTLLPFAAWPIVGWIVRRGRVWRRKRRGCCFQCGYDLRGAEERCPECGAPKVPV